MVLRFELLLLTSVRTRKIPILDVSDASAISSTSRQRRSSLDMTPTHSKRNLRLKRNGQGLRRCESSGVGKDQSGNSTTLSVSFGITPKGVKPFLKRVGVGLHLKSMVSA